MSERAHYLAVGGEGDGELFLIQLGCAEHLGAIAAHWRRERPEPRDGRSEPTPHHAPGSLRRALGLAFAFAA